MKINKFKLINGGKQGISVKADEYLSSNVDGANYQIVDGVERKRKVPLSNELLDKIDELKYYFLTLTGHWISSYNKFYDKEIKNVIPIPMSDPSKPHLLLVDLWKRVEITAASADHRGFVISGTIEVIEGKKMNINTPRISRDDDYGFFEECLEVLDDIANGIEGYIKSHTLSLERVKEVISIEGADDKTETEINSELIDKLHSMGAVVMIQEGSELDKLVDGNEDGNVEVIQSGTIDKENVEEATDLTQEDNDPIDEQGAGLEDEDPDWKFTPPVEVNSDIAKPVGSLPGQDSDQAPVDDLSTLEHSENMGLDQDFEID